MASQQENNPDMYDSVQQSQGQNPQNQQPQSYQPQFYQNQQTINIVMPAPRKSVGLSLVLTFFFGPLGMFYSTILGAVVMLIVSVIIGVLTLGFGLFITQPICMIWGAVAASNSNNQI